jgi:myosin heavy subunit
MKILFILSMVAMIVALVFGTQNRKTFIQTRTEKDETNAKTTKGLAELNDLVDQTSGMIAERKVMEGERDEAREALAAAERKLTQKKAELAAEQSKLEKLQAEYAVFQEKLEKLPAGMTPASLGEDIKRLRQTKVDKETDLENLKKELEVAQTNLETNNRSLGGHKKRQVDRNEALALNTMEATVTAVNQDWGFVLVNMGSEQGVRADSSLLVVQEGKPVAKLRIIQLDANRLIADLDQDTLDVSGVVPGAKVLLEVPNEG